MTPIIRAATESDLSAIARIGAQSFPGVNAKTREKQIRESSQIGVEDILVAEESGRLLGSATVIPMEMWWAGNRWPTGGLASVAVAPEARRQGVATRLCGAAVDRLRERDVPLCLLYPFETEFYTALGWSLVGLRREVTLRPSALPTGERGEVVWLDPRQDANALMRCHGEWLEQRGVGLVRHPAIWSRIFDQPWQWFGIRDGDRLDGYVAMYDDRDPVTICHTLRVGEIIALSSKSQRALTAFLHDQQAQVDWVELSLPAETPVEAMVSSPRTPGQTDLGCGNFLCSQICTGAMVRVLDWNRLMADMASIGTWLRGSLEIGLRRGPHWRLNMDGRWIEVDQGDADNTLTADEATLTKILWGVLSLSDAVAWGLADLRGKADLRALGALLAQPPLFIPRWDNF
ncbi:GNAT family N-acetyltransferase [Candidatus Sumerlaeota bacterium]|nr:GNAT family N-acetyltransferase [Candidatus Sumerlaeota bacterium]